MRIRKCLQILLLAVVVAVLACLWLIGPKIGNMKAEYATAEVIRDLTTYVAGHDGEWPSSAAAFRKEVPTDVWIDYSLTAERILATPEILKDSVRPKAGKFQTYPHHGRDLSILLDAMRKAKSEADPARD
ncbi:hypothetical protein [Luteolibacter luteus]|uniref:Uncharacterized protein n=1 Tax=Luteolibacter luteus TaxID=2728835 RepID=A0A858RJB0_9BACT|nr:hypothetical protein [Luteolibacter luteus]QJE96568.1 hypothetical protein HHL09_12500 [Luteolibacter luteus]